MSLLLVPSRASYEVAAVILPMSYRLRDALEPEPRQPSAGPVSQPPEDTQTHDGTRMHRKVS